MGLEEGTLVTPRVRLARPIGQGGMGSVWAAEHTTLGIEVAVKLVSPERLAADAMAIARFEREAALAARIDSPHAVRIFDHGVMSDGAPYMVMELLRGETLTARLRRSQRLEPPAIAAIVSQLASVLASAHELGIVHRDIKPDNVYLVESEYDVFVKLLDFGIAKSIHVEAPAVLTSTGAVLGTPHYMSPEQLLGQRDVDHRADLWATAVVAYQALTGRRPFDGPSMAALSLAICHGEYAHPSSLLEGVPPALDAWFARAFSVTPEDRFASAREMARALRGALGSASHLVERAVASGADAPARPPAQVDTAGTAPPTASASLPAVTKTLAPVVRQRHRVLTAAGILAAIGAGVLLLGAGWLAIRQVDHARPVAGTHAGEPHLAAVTALTSLPAPASEPSVPEPSVPEPSVPEPSVPAPSEAPAPRPLPHAEAARPAVARPAYCDTDQGYVADADGHLMPRHECLGTRR